VQFAADLQSYNRYSYTGNNPLRYTDPTGFFWSEIGDWLSDPHNLFNVGMAIVGVVVCAASEGAGCVAFGLMLAAMNATIAIANGASWQQTLLITGIGLTVGLISGGVANAAGGGALAGIIAGSVSAAVTTGISNVIAGRSFFEWNVLTAAAISAAEAGITMGLQRAIGVSQASADVGEGGSGSKRIERADGAAATDPDIDEKIENAKLEAAISGQTSTRQVGSLEVTVYGGTEAERQTALDALSTDLTQTDRGQQILDRLVNGPGADGPEIRPLEVVVYHGSGTFSYPDYRQIVFDPGDIGKPYWADPGVGYMSPDRLFAHELGHVVGYHDDGVGGLNNILTNENPIMKQLGDPFNRTRLEPVR
jgi:hypothetical protein